MLQFIESIKLLDGEYHNLPLHDERRYHTLVKVTGMKPKETLSQLLDLTLRPLKGLYKCRVIYNEDACQVEHVPYAMKRFDSLKVVSNDSIDYSFKFENRTDLNEIFQQRGACDEVVIVRNGWVTDASYANLLFKFGNDWITPTTCLLNGVMRQRLLADGKIKEDEIRVNDLSKFESVKLINAMLVMDGNEVPVNKIII
ncbi:MAG: aminotransferase class IV [Flammeovirgaceae bacterium]